MRINHAAALVAAICVCVTTAGEARAATPSTTTVDLTVLRSGASIPVASATVAVYYNPSDPPKNGSASLKRIGSGTTDSQGQLALHLNFAAIPRAALASTGTRDQWFNSEIVTWDPATGRPIVSERVVHLNQSRLSPVIAPSHSGAITQRATVPPVDAVTVRDHYGSSCSGCLPAQTKWLEVGLLNSSFGGYAEFLNEQGNPIHDHWDGLVVFRRRAVERRLICLNR